MRLFLSSDVFGGHEDELLKLVGDGRNAVLIANAADYKPTKAERDQRVAFETDNLTALGFEVEELDLRAAQHHDITELMDWADLVWVRGGNVFDLRLKMERDGFIDSLTEQLQNDTVAYGGYSAGAAVAGSTLKGLDAMDPVEDIENTIWDGLKLVDYAIVPHWQSGEWSRSAQKSHQIMERESVAHKLLADGTVIVVEGDNGRILK